MAKLDIHRLKEFGLALQSGELDNSCIRGETHCLREDPAVGYFLWEAENREVFEERFAPWRRFCAESQVSEVMPAEEAMGLLMSARR
ncbi:MAG: hypothetical protein JXA20_11770 [Spirochaetes bacterium]|nr:hypothetical protein [Spirochaetota bacterium]